MGASSSSELSAEDIEEIHNDTQFSRKAIQRLYKRFKDLDKTNVGLLSPQDFLSIPEFAINPLGLRIIALFDEQRSDEINFKQFCKTLSLFRPEAPLRDKLNLVFRLYDVDDNQRIERDELFNVVKRMVGSNITDGQLWQLVDKVILDSKGGKVTDPAELQFITRANFQSAMADAQLQQKMSIRF